MGIKIINVVGKLLDLLEDDCDEQTSRTTANMMVMKIAAMCERYFVEMKCGEEKKENKRQIVFLIVNADHLSIRC